MPDDLQRLREAHHEHLPEPAWRVEDIPGRVRARRRRTRGAVAAGLAAAAGVALVVTLSSATEPSPQPASSTGPPWTTQDGEMLVRCGTTGAPFPPSVLTTGGLDLTPAERAEVDAALDRLRSEAGIDGPQLLQDSTGDVPWVAVGQQRAGEDLTLLLPATAKGKVELGSAEVVTLERTRSDLQTTGWGGRCGAVPALGPGSSWVELSREGSPDPGATTVPLLLMETVCTGGRDPSPHLREPYVVETDESVTIYWTSTPPDGGTCPSNPSVERSVTLAKPLGDRALLDGSVYPAEPIGELPRWQQGSR